MQTQEVRQRGRIHFEFANFHYALIVWFHLGICGVQL